jgi:hypothetical protein
MSDYHLSPDEEKDAWINDADSGMPADPACGKEPYKEISRSESAAQFFDDLERWWEEHPNTINEVRKRIKERERSHD